MTAAGRGGRAAAGADARHALRADCARCAGLCCVAPAFAASADFALDKPAGAPCPHLTDGFRCAIHDRLRERGFAGCAAFDCFGAGQQVVQVTFGGRTWRDDPALAGPMFAVFAVMRQLNEMLWHLAEALALLRPGDLRADVEQAGRSVRRLTGRGPDEVAGMDVASLREEIGSLLARVSDAVRAGVHRRSPDRAGADLAGAALAGADLRGASLRGALLLGADLRRADLRLADMLGADLRASDLRGADLSTAIFLTQPQVGGAIGDPRTRLPATLTRPQHWTSAGARPR